MLLTTKRLYLTMINMRLRVNKMTHRYVPFVQQPYCCVAACFQIVMYKHGIPLIPQEELAYEMGLVVPEKDMQLFNKVRTGEKPSSGWGTQIQKEEYSPNKLFQRLNVPLQFSRLSNKDLKDADGLRKLLEEIEKEDKDALLCFDYGRLWDVPSNGGHVCVFDRIEGDEVHIIDPERNVPKYRTATLSRLFDAMDFHGEHNATGVWLLDKAN